MNVSLKLRGVAAGGTQRLFSVNYLLGEAINIA